MNRMERKKGETEAGETIDDDKMEEYDWVEGSLVNLYEKDDSTTHSICRLVGRQSYEDTTKKKDSMEFKPQKSQRAGKEHSNLITALTGLWGSLSENELIDGRLIYQPYDITSSELKELSRSEREVIDILAKYDFLPPEQVADIHQISPESAREIYESYEDIICIREREIIYSFICEISDRDIKDKWNDATQKQKSVIIELIKEQDPKNPEAERSDIARRSGAHSTYIPNIVSQYGELAVHLRRKRMRSEGVNSFFQKMSTRKEVSRKSLSEVSSQIDRIVEVAEKEIEAGDSDIAVGRKSAAEQISQMINQIL